MPSTHATGSRGDEKKPANVGGFGVASSAGAGGAQGVNRSLLAQAADGSQLGHQFGWRADARFGDQDLGFAGPLPAPTSLDEFGAPHVVKDDALAAGKQFAIPAASEPVRQVLDLMGLDTLLH